MTNSERDQWKELCEAIMQEPDSSRLLELVEKLNETLERREIAKQQERRSLSNQSLSNRF